MIGAGHKVMINAGTLLIVPDAGTYMPNTTYTIITTQDGGTASSTMSAGGVGFLTPKLSARPPQRLRHPGAGAQRLRARRDRRRTSRRSVVPSTLIAASGNVGGIITTMANLPTAQGAPALQALSGQPYADLRHAEHARLSSCS